MAYKKTLVYSELSNKIYLASVNEKGISDGKTKEDVTDWAIRLVSTVMKEDKVNYKVNFNDGDYKLTLTKIGE